jgi:hypothetical protein
VRHARILLKRFRELNSPNAPHDARSFLCRVRGRAVLHKITESFFCRRQINELRHYLGQTSSKAHDIYVNFHITLIHLWHYAAPNFGYHLIQCRNTACKWHGFSIPMQCKMLGAMFIQKLRQRYWRSALPDNMKKINAVERVTLNTSKLKQKHT